MFEQPPVNISSHENLSLVPYHYPIAQREIDRKCKLTCVELLFQSQRLTPAYFENASSSFCPYNLPLIKQYYVMTNYIVKVLKEDLKIRQNYFKIVNTLFLTLIQDNEGCTIYSELTMLISVPGMSNTVCKIKIGISHQLVLLYLFGVQHPQLSALHWC